MLCRHGTAAWTPPVVTLLIDGVAPLVVNKVTSSATLVPSPAVDPISRIGPLLWSSHTKLLQLYQPLLKTERISRQGHCQRLRRRGEQAGIVLLREPTRSRPTSLSCALSR
jgi:hypothetical protein